MRWRRALLFVLVLFLLTACAPGPNPEIGTAGAAEAPAGFWLGLWHGVIVLVTFVVSLFTDDVTVYEVHNACNWYDAGFVLGLTISLGGSSAGGGRAARRR